MGTMKILQVIAYLNPKFGGDVNVCCNLSKCLAKRGHEITILTSDFDLDAGYVKNIEDQGIRVVSCKTIENFGFFIYSPSIKTWLRENGHDFDVIHMHNFRSYQNNCVYDFAREHNIPYIIQAHGSVLPVLEKRGLKKLYDVVWGNRLLKKASGFIAVSRTEKMQYLRADLPDSIIEIIPNTIDISEYYSLPDRGMFRKKFGIRPDSNVILYLGRLHRSKGMDFLLEGFSHLLVKNNKSKLVIAGPDAGFLDNLKKKVKQLKIEDNVIFSGPLYNNEKSEAMVDADVLVYPGHIEIFGLVPFEALMCGTPVIVTDDCGCGEIVKEQQCGGVIKYGDIHGLVDTIIDILDNPRSAKDKVGRGQEYIKKYLTWEANISKFENLYENCVRIG
jgi:glycosyltransferase involved in cell wall biosynthesis